MTLAGKQVLMTIGPTYEHLDPVRFIGNHSSGKMGFAIAKVLKKEGAQLTLIVGPVSSIPEELKEYCIPVMGAEEMLAKAQAAHPKADICIFTAAVSDYRPAKQEAQKIKKSSSELQITLVKNPDIALQLGKQKKEHQLHIGFALETENEQVNAQAKLEKKNFDLIILNSLNDKGAGFKTDTNKISIIDRNKIRNFELKSKSEVAHDIVEAIKDKLQGFE